MRARKAVLTVMAVSIAATATAALYFEPWRERGADDRYDVLVTTPALREIAPRVLFDHGHNNVHSATGRYRPFVRLIESDGCSVKQMGAAFTAELLRQADILVVVNAKGPRPNQDSSAYTTAEIRTVREWVQGGGSLLLVADHHPCGEAAAKLAAAFGVEMSGGWTDDQPNARQDSGDPGQLLFTRAAGSLADHAITAGRNDDERVGVVETFTGQSLSGPPESVALLALHSTAMDRIPVTAVVTEQGSTRTTTFETEDRSAAGRSQGLAMRFGDGRVVVLGEAAMLTAQIDDKSGRPFGMNAPGNDNRAFALNVIRWLAGALDQ